MDILLTSDYYVDIVVQEKFEVYFLTKGESQARKLDIYSLVPKEGKKTPQILYQKSEKLQVKIMCFSSKIPNMYFL